MNPLDLKDDIVVFDIDGVLAKFDFGNGKKFYEDESWVQLNMNKDMYKNIERTSLFNDLIEELDPSRIYVISMACTSFEQNNKLKFIDKIGKIRADHVFFVANDKYKKTVLQELRYKYDRSSNNWDKRIVMIEDSCSIMADIEMLQDEKLRCFVVSDFI